MSRANLKRGHTRQNGGNTSHPVREYKSHTRKFRPVGVYKLLGRDIPIDKDGRDGLGWYILDDCIKIKTEG